MQKIRSCQIGHGWVTLEQMAEDGSRAAGRFHSLLTLGSEGSSLEKDLHCRAKLSVLTRSLLAVNEETKRESLVARTGVDEQE